MVSCISYTKVCLVINNFIPGLQVRDTAWQAFVQSGLSDGLEIDLLYRLHSHYALQDIYRSMSYQTVQNIVSTKSLAAALNVSNTTENSIFDEQLNLLVSIEAGLIESNNLTLNLFNEKF